MKILLLGANGQVGWQLRRSLSVIGEVTALARGTEPLSGDLSRPDALARTVQAVGPDVIVNAAAYTAVDKAETEREAAFAINATACEVLAAQAERIGAWLVHYSTDYVFDGTGERPWTEDDATGPINAYGESKLAGEHAVTAGTKRHLILRTSWVFDTWGQNFLKSILRAAAQRDSLNVVADQWGAPTRAALIADVTAHLLSRLRPEAPGVYHLAAAGQTSWHGYARLAVAHAAECGMALKTSADRVLPIPASQYPVAAARPGNSRLDTTRLRRTFGLDLPPWEDGVRSVVAELAAFSPKP
ncbi:dTDP-4-dehydrorhamnose reductase [Caenimonas aquaedulcis]|uniref:dTDP-4-dehydrorhamnose reductase n=1 Tax=Caenimonas aquaedulcis TaxID=2793270 RepID=A0A931MIG3_9BURK|nr:dTDP-4-dehydrorhamnose reductase [Caenimonas aquaedulcis]MBG9389809.1 dTDP-4-dehydrorhamnose reductase [Caenimonas aquaedulcis]